MQKSDLSFKKGIKDGLPIGLGYLSVSFAFGVQASIAGVPLIMSVFISMTNLTSAGQLAGLSIIAGLGTILEMILTQLVINARYFLMSITLSQKLDQTFTLRHRLLCSAFVTDEIFAIAAAKPKTFGKIYFYGLVILPYLGWTIGTLLGGAAGNVLPTQITNALGIALYAMFIAIIVPPAVKVRGVFIAVSISIAISCLLFYLPLFSTLSDGFKFIISAITASAITAFFFPLKAVEEEI